MKDTKQKILDEALSILNASGLSALSIRAVAESLQLSPGNVSYHFRRKEDLVFGLVQRLGQGNQAHLDQTPGSLSELLDLFGTLFRRQHGFRGLALALPDLLASFDDIRAHYRSAEVDRKEAVYRLLEHLRDEGALEASDKQLWRIVSHLVLISRFWIGEARVSYSQVPLKRVIAHYQALIADTLQPYVATGCDELETYLDGWIDPAPGAR